NALLSVANCVFPLASVNATIVKLPFAEKAGLKPAIATPLPEFVKMSPEFAVFTVMHEELWPNASAPFPAPTVPAFEMLMVVLVAFTNRTRAVPFAMTKLLRSLLSHAASTARDASAQRVSVRNRMKPSVKRTIGERNDVCIRSCQGGEAR